MIDKLPKAWFQDPDTGAPMESKEVLEFVCKMINSTGPQPINWNGHRLGQVNSAYVDDRGFVKIKMQESGTYPGVISRAEISLTLQFTTGIKLGDEDWHSLIGKTN